MTTNYKIAVFAGDGIGPYADTDADGAGALRRVQHASAPTGICTLSLHAGLPI